MSSCQQGPGVTFPCEQFYQHPDKFHCHGTPANSSTIQRVAARSLWLGLDPSGTIKWRGGSSRSVPSLHGIIAIVTTLLFLHFLEHYLPPGRQSLGFPGEASGKEPAC